LENAAAIRFLTYHNAPKNELFTPQSLVFSCFAFIISDHI